MTGRSVIRVLEFVLDDSVQCQVLVLFDKKDVEALARRPYPIVTRSVVDIVGWGWGGAGFGGGFATCQEDVTEWFPG